MPWRRGNPDLNVLAGKFVRKRFMPYPHKNSDGVIPKQKAAEDGFWGFYPAEYQPKTTYPTMDELKDMLKSTYGLPVVEHKDLYANSYFSNPSFAQYVPPPSVVANMSLVEKEKLLNQLKKYGVIPNSWGYKEDPVLIPATEKKQSIWDDYPSLPTTAKHKAFYTTLYVDMPGVPDNKRKIGCAWSLDASHDYTESEIRAKLQDSFKRMEEEIIKSLKENKK